MSSDDSQSRPRKEYYKVLVGVHKFCVDKRYQNLVPIGDGSYGLVASAIDTLTGQAVAIKKIRDTFIDIVDAKRILREIKLLRHFKAHSNIVKIVDIMVYPPNKPAFDDIYIVTNLYESDLEKIIKSRQNLTDRHLQFFLYQLLRGLKFVHSAHVLHRDLKPSNILVNANCDLALCDFGLARGYDIEADDQLTTYVVTRWYRAPEVLCNSPTYGKGLDIWSAGCVFAELITHSPIFCGENPQHQLQEIIRKVGCPRDPTKLSFVQSPAALQALLRYGIRARPVFASFFPTNTNPLAIDLLERMLQFNPEDRITVDEALDHDYLKAFHEAMPDISCPQPFDFEFEKLIQGESAEVKNIVRYFMYEEMRIYRPRSPAADEPWSSNRSDAKSSPTAMERTVSDVVSGLKRSRQGQTPLSIRQQEEQLLADSRRGSDAKSEDRLIEKSVDDEDFDDALSDAPRDDDKTPVAVYASGASSFFGGDASNRFAAEKYLDDTEDVQFTQTGSRADAKNSKYS